MSQDGIIESSQLDNWTFGGDTAIAAPEGYNAHAEGFARPPVGWHTMELYDYTVKTDQTFTFKGETCVLDQLRPQFRVVEGHPYAGATVMDFLPMPTRGVQMLPDLASRWVHFLKRLMGPAFVLQDGLLVPAGFKLGEIKKKPVDVQIVHDLDQSNEPKRDKDGSELVKPRYFGYAFAGTMSGGTAATENAKAHGGGKPANGRGAASSQSKTDPSRFDPAKVVGQL